MQTLQIVLRQNYNYMPILKNEKLLLKIKKVKEKLKDTFMEP